MVNEHSNEAQCGTSTGYSSVADLNRYPREIQRSRSSQYHMTDDPNHHSNKDQRSTSTGYPSIADPNSYPTGIRETRPSQYSMLDVHSQHSNEGQRYSSKGYQAVTDVSPYPSGSSHQGLHPFHHTPEWTGSGEGQFGHEPDVISSRTKQNRRLPIVTHPGQHLYQREAGGHVESASDGGEMVGKQREVLPVILSVTSLSKSWRKEVVGGDGSTEK
ncbi:uncharacterized protein [Amphiura filiformis]|uniref:uncharacterized protein n=1 Tax=Amphiura filiformis TaxID=82378 RepID=UPI003B220077